MKQLDSMSFCGSGAVGSKGQVVIPKDLRDAQNIGEGDKLIFMGTPHDGVFVVMKAENLSVITEKLQTKLNKLNSLQNSQENK